MVCKWHVMSNLEEVPNTVQQYSIPMKAIDILHFIYRDPYMYKEKQKTKDKRQKKKVMANDIPSYQPSEG